MAYIANSMPVCPANRDCADWARKYLYYCLCSVRDGLSLSLGLVSVLCWGVAEVPQIITNYKKKSTEGLSVAFLMTWIIGDLFNVFGCLLEPATLPTQYYTALLYTLTTILLTSQTLYYRHIYSRMTFNKKEYKDPKPLPTESGRIPRHSNSDTLIHNIADKLLKKSGTSEKENTLSYPIPLPTVSQNGSPHVSAGRALYYMSARYLSSSHTPTAGSLLPQRTPSCNSLEEPLLSAQSAPPPNTKSLLCVVFAIVFLGNIYLQQLESRGSNLLLESSYHGVVLRVGRRLLQLGYEENSIEGNRLIGTYLGWAMAAIYMGGRLPQICLNIRRGNVEGLNPLMFMFALVANATYVASILVNSVEWSKLRPNLPWLVESGGCVLLDTFILIQFLYFQYWKTQNSEDKHESVNSA